MTGFDVVDVARTLQAKGVPFWIGGGWGVDALVGRQTRDHRDLDIAIPGELDGVAIDALGSLGYTLAVDERPVRFVLRAADARSIDLHPVAFSAAGHGVQQGFDGVVFHYPADGFTVGRVARVDVPCLTLDQQIAFHLGYEPQDHDRHDMAILADHVGIVPPEPY
jgi:lincosamide nucleotidyltransferase A/C/D/E